MYCLRLGAFGSGALLAAALAGMPAVAFAGPTFPLTTSAQFNASSAQYVIAPDGSTSYVERTGTTGIGGLRISYDQRRGAYSVTDLADGYAATNLRRARPTGIYDVYTRSSRGILDELKIYNAARAGAAAVPLSYVSFGLWKHRELNSATTRQYALVFGSQTPASGVPRSGTASYRTMVNGTSTVIGTNGGTRDVGGSAAFNVDFGAATVSTELNLAYVTGGAQTPIGTFSGSSGIYSGQFWGSLSSSAPYFVAGSFAGGFYGPTAQEMGYSFSIYRHNYDPYAGAAVNYHDEAIVGTVVGARN